MKPIPGNTISYIFNEFISLIFYSKVPYKIITNLAPFALPKIFNYILVLSRTIIFEIFFPKTWNRNTIYPRSVPNPKKVDGGLQNHDTRNLLEKNPVSTHLLLAKKQAKNRCIPNLLLFI